MEPLVLNPVSYINMPPLNQRFVLRQSFDCCESIYYGNLKKNPGIMCASIRRKLECSYTVVFKFIVLSNRVVNNFITRVIVPNCVSGLFGHINDALVFGMYLFPYVLFYSSNDVSFSFCLRDITKLIKELAFLPRNEPVLTVGCSSHSLLQAMIDVLSD